MEDDTYIASHHCTPISDDDEDKAYLLRQVCYRLDRQWQNQFPTVEAGIRYQEALQAAKASVIDFVAGLEAIGLGELGAQVESIWVKTYGN